MKCISFDLTRENKSISEKRNYTFHDIYGLKYYVVKGDAHKCRHHSKIRGNSNNTRNSRGAPTSFMDPLFICIKINFICYFFLLIIFELFGN